MSEPGRKPTDLLVSTKINPEGLGLLFLDWTDSYPDKCYTMKKVYLEPKMENFYSLHENDGIQLSLRDVEYLRDKLNELIKELKNEM